MIIIGFQCLYFSILIYLGADVMSKLYACFLFNLRVHFTASYNSTIKELIESESFFLRIPLA